MNEEKYKREFLGVFEPDNSYEATLKRVKRAQLKAVARELTHLYAEIARLKNNDE